MVSYTRVYRCGHTREISLSLNVEERQITDYDPVTKTQTSQMLCDDCYVAQHGHTVGFSIGGVGLGAKD